MNLYQCLVHDMGIRDVFHWWSRTPIHVSMTPLEDTTTTDQASEFIEPLLSATKPIACDFHRLNVRPGFQRTHSSLLTKAINAIQDDRILTGSATRASNPPSIAVNNMCSNQQRPRSIMSSMSMGLTSDGGTTTSSSHSNTPSSSFDGLRPKSTHTGNIKLDETNLVGKVNSIKWLDNDDDYDYDDKHQIDHIALTTTGDDKKVSNLDTYRNALDSSIAPPRRPCSITFECKNVDSDATRHRIVSNRSSDFQTLSPSKITSQVMTTAHHAAPQLPRKSTIKFACAAPEVNKATVTSNVNDATLLPPRRKYSEELSSLSSLQHQSIEATNNTCARSLKSLQIPQTRASMSDDTPGSSEATRFYEFAGEEEEVDDWLRRDLDTLTSKLTISDTLKKENLIRRLASEVEEEELENEADGDGRDDSEEEPLEYDDEDTELAFSSSDDDGNETDNEAGFAESDQSDAEEDSTIWAPGSNFLSSNDNNIDYSVTSHHRAASTSSIDSLGRFLGNYTNQDRQKRLRKLRSEALELPDSTDFVCGTFDEDRCLEDAYLSRLKARKQARHRLTPQDIDPSFPTSDNDDMKTDKRNSGYVKRQARNPYGSLRSRRIGNNQSRDSSILSHNSPKKLHSPPPPRQRLRSPPPRKLSGNSSKRLQLSTLSPIICRSESESSKSRPINFTPLAFRPRPTHTKSLPRKANPLCRTNPGSQVSGPDENNLHDHCDTINHVRSAIDIVKGLEQKRLHREENFLKQNRSGNVKENTVHMERTSHAKRGADFMREVGLIMADEAGIHKTYVLSA